MYVIKVSDQTECRVETWNIFRREWVGLYKVLRARDDALSGLNFSKGHALIFRYRGCMHLAILRCTQSKVTIAVDTCICKNESRVCIY